MSGAKNWTSIQRRIAKYFHWWLLKSITKRVTSIAPSRAFLPVIVGVIALNLIWLYWNFSKARTLWETPLANGDKLPEIVGRDISTSKAVKLANNSWQLLMYYDKDSAFDTGKAKYVDLLVNKYGQRNFSAVGIITVNCQRLKALAVQHELSYPLILDEKQRIAHLLGLGNHMHATFVADPNGIIRFATTAPHIEEEDLRQLVEKFLLGTVTYPDSTMGQNLRVGDSFPSLLMEEIGSGKLVSLDEQAKRAYHLYVIFTADCPQCSLSSYLHSLESLRRLSESRGQQVMAIFSSRFSPDQLLEQALRHQLTIPLYIAKQEIPGLEDAYYLRSFTSEVVVIVTSSDGVVRRVSPLNEYIGQLTVREVQ